MKGESSSSFHSFFLSEHILHLFPFSYTQARFLNYTAVIHNDKVDLAPFFPQTVGGFVQWALTVKLAPVFSFCSCSEMVKKTLIQQNLLLPLACSSPIQKRKKTSPPIFIFLFPPPPPHTLSSLPQPHQAPCPHLKKACKFLGAYISFDDILSRCGISFTAAALCWTCC